MSSGCLNIDYFIHNILDYTLLNNNGGRFKKHISVFNIKKSTFQMTHILKDKTSMKNITVST